MTRRSMRWAAAVAALTVLTSCSSSDSAKPSTNLAAELAGKVSADGMYTHLTELQKIADANGGSRSNGTPGYDASIDYVAGILRDKGFDVQTPEVDVLARTEGGNPQLTIGGRDFTVDQASLLITTPRGGLNAETLRPQNAAAGCRAADYGSISMKGAIAVVDDTGCSIVDKENAAVDRGAVGLLVVSVPGANGSPAGLFTPGYYQKLTVPVGIIGNDANAALRRTTASVKLVLDNRPVMKKVRNVLAQTKSGDTKNVVMVGAHLDSSARSPGINDDGSGIAAVLETASALGSAPQIRNAVRFALWGSEENSLQGATKYIRGLQGPQLDEIALYLNLEMIGSPNAGYFTYDGDQSGQPNPEIPLRDVPDGSAGIERTLAGYLNSAGVRPADMPLTRYTDYYSFLTAGIPVGGVTTGANQMKTEVQARLWGGRAGVAYDPNYRTPRDTIDNVNRDALAKMGSAAAFAVGTYAQSVEGVNGVPAFDQRHRSAP